MSISSTTTSVAYDGTGAQLQFAVSFPFMAASDLAVAVDGVIQVLNTDYTVTGGSDSTGNVIFNSAPPTGSGNVLIQRITPALQPTNFRTQGQFYPKVHEVALDRLTMLIQEILSDIEWLIAAYTTLETQRLPFYGTLGALPDPSAEWVNRLVVLRGSGGDELLFCRETTEGYEWITVAF